MQMADKHGKRSLLINRWKHQNISHQETQSITTEWHTTTWQLEWLRSEKSSHPKGWPGYNPPAALTLTWGQKVKKTLSYTRKTGGSSCKDLSSIITANNVANTYLLCAPAIPAKVSNRAKCLYESLHISYQNNSIAIAKRWNNSMLSVRWMNKLLCNI